MNNFIILSNITINDKFKQELWYYDCAKKHDFFIIFNKIKIKNHDIKLKNLNINIKKNN